jgi:predicted nucleotide-binding protein (sugar kinase/HSP70/actin superfamily)
LIRSRGKKQQDLFQVREGMWLAAMKGKFEELKGEPLMESEGRPTVGMQRSLYTLQSGVLWAHFFDRLGMRLVLTPATNTRITSAGIESMTSETCFPVKVSHGHVKELAGKTKYFFLPAIITMPTPREEETGFYCPLVQANTYMVQAALNLEEEQILNPTIHMKYDIPTIALELSEQISRQIGRSHAQIREALEYGWERQQQFLKELFKKGREVMGSFDPERPVVVVTGRPYTLHDERLNLRLGQNLAKVGVAAIPMDFVDVSGVDLSDFPNMYWGLGAQILRTAKFIKERPNYFGLHMTNFSCGADSFVEHFYKYIMGDKPYLILELDEHSAVAGVMTRLEAFKNVIENSMEKMQQHLYPSLKMSN